jgi:soluble lytic murein transglycosylase-like protein
MTLASFAKSGILASILAILAVSTAQAASNDWQLCRDAALRLEQQHNLPQGMITSIALVESGRRSPDGSVQSWPWTINAEGRPYYFASRAEAVDAVRRLLSEGKRIIDVGCMQINLRYHPRAFTSVEEAFDPMSNMAYAAYFLRDLESRSANWEQAIGRYHSFSPSLNERYTARVQAVWAREQVASVSESGTSGSISQQDDQRTSPTATIAATGLRLSSYNEDELEPAKGNINAPGLTTASIQ